MGICIGKQLLEARERCVHGISLHMHDLRIRQSLQDERDVQEVRRQLVYEAREISPNLSCRDHVGIAELLTVDVRGLFHEPCGESLRFPVVDEPPDAGAELAQFTCRMYLRMTRDDALHQRGTGPRLPHDKDG